MSGVVGFVTRNFWQESPPRDPELGIPPREACCFPEHICRDWTQYLSVGGTLLAVGGVGYGYFRKDYEVATVAALLGIIILVNCARIWCVMPAVRLSRSVRAVAEERKKTKEQLDQATRNLSELENSIADLKADLEIEQRTLSQEKSQNQQTIQSLQEQVTQLEVNRKKYETLQQNYDKILAGLKAQEAQVKQIRATSKTVEQAAKTIGKDKGCLSNSTANLHDAVDRLDGENDEFGGENDELLGHLANLEKQIARMGTYVGTLERLLAEINAARDAAVRALRQAQQENSVAQTLADAAAALAESESDLSNPSGRSSPDP